MAIKDKLHLEKDTPLEVNIGKTEPTAYLVFGSDNGKELMSFCHNGQIFHKGRLITTDKELVEGLRDILLNYRCSKCKNLL